MNAGNNPVVIYGTGNAGRAAYEIYAQYNVVAFCTSCPSEGENTLYGLPIISPAEIPSDAIVYIASMYAHEISCTLRKLGIVTYKDVTPTIKSLFTFGVNRSYFSSSFLDKNKTNINYVRELLSDDTSKSVFDSVIGYRRTLDPFILKPSDFPQYCHPALHYVPCSNVVIGGAYDGDTIEILREAYKHKIFIHAFEPDSFNFCRLFNKFKGDVDIKMYAFGLWREIDVLQFFSSEAPSQCTFKKHAKDNSMMNVTAMPLDAILPSTKVDMVTLDIEGAETEALLGMSKIISTHRPSLAVSVYHLPDDLWRIPTLLSSLCPDYNFYLGHHSFSVFDTVFYASPKWR